MRSLAWLYRVLAATVLVAQLGCLHDEDPPKGTQLLAGHGFRSPYITEWPDGSKRMMFESPSETSNYGEVQGWNLEVVPLPDPGNPDAPPFERVQLAPNVEQGLSWDALHHLFVRHDTVQVGGRTAATIRRIDLTTGTHEEFASALNLSVDYGSGRFTYETLTAAQAAAGERAVLHFNDGQGNDTLVGKVSGLVTMMSGELWMVSGPELTLQRIAAPGAAAESYIDGVESFWWHWPSDGSLAAVMMMRPADAASGKRKLIDYNFATRSSVDLPSTSYVSVLGTSHDGRRFIYTDGDAEGGILHQVDLETGDDDPLVIQAGVQIVRIINRPVTGEPLYVDGNGSLFFIDPANPGRLSAIYVTVRRESFSDDGKYMFATVHGQKSPIYVLDADELYAGRSSNGFPLVPEDIKVSRFQPVYGGSQIVFWGYYGEAVADLYIVDVKPGAPLKKLAPQVDLLNTNLITLVGMIHSSPQDGLSDLVKLNLETGEETLYARSVSDFALYPACKECDWLGAGASLVYMVNTRTGSARDGIWVTNL